MSDGKPALSQQEEIEQFCGITGATEEMAKSFLEACSWNLELAINMHVDTQDKPSTSTSSANRSNNAAGPSTRGNHPEVVDINDTIMKDNNDDDPVNVGDDDSSFLRSSGRQSNSRSNRARQHNDNNRGRNDDTTSSISRSLQQGTSSGSSSSRTNFNTQQQFDNKSSSSSSAAAAAAMSDDVRPPIPPIRQVLVRGNDYQGPHETPQRRYNTRSGNISDVYDAFRDFQAEAQWQEMAAGGSSAQEGESSNTDFSLSSASSNNYNRRKTLNDLFRPPLELIHRGSLDSAREAGQKQNKWILVNVQDARVFACQTLNRDLWSNQTVKDIIKQHFIFWQVYHDSYDGKRFQQFYKTESHPHISIIDPRTGEELKSWPNLTSIDHNSFCDSVIEFLTEQSLPDGNSSDASSMKKLRVKEDDDEPEEVDNNLVQPTLYDQSEEAQLEAAIKASLQEQIATENSNSSKAFADEDSYPDAMESDNDQTRTSDTQYHSNNSNSANEFKFSQNMTSQEPFSGIGNSIGASTSTSTSSSRKNNNTNNSNHSDRESNCRNVDIKSSSSKQSNAERNNVKKEKKEVVDVDEYKKYLGVDEEKFSDLNIRFPDGTRDQQKFPSDTLMKALFLLLSAKGYSIEEYNYVTNFPRRLLHELPTTQTLQDAKLTRETIFVERKTN